MTKTEQYNKYIDNMSHWQREFPQLSEEDLKGLLFKATTAGKHPRVYWNERPIDTVAVNQQFAQSMSIFENTENDGPTIKGIQVAYIVVIFNYCKRLTYFQTINEIHEGIIKAYETQAKKYEKAGQTKLASEARQRIPEEGTVSGRVLELETAGILTKIKVLREHDKGGKKYTKHKSGYMVPLDLKESKWSQDLQNLWKRAVDELNNKGKHQKQTAKMLMDLCTDKHLTYEEKMVYLDSIFNLYKVYVYDPNESLWDDLKRIDKEINIKADEERETKRNERLEKEAAAKKSKALSDAMRDEMGLSPVNITHGDYSKDRAEGQAWGEIIEKSNKEADEQRRKLQIAREQSDAIMKKYGLGPYKKT